MSINGRDVGGHGRLVAMREDRSELEAKRTLRLEDSVSDVKRASGEDSGLWSEPIQPLLGRGGIARLVLAARCAGHGAAALRHRGAWFGRRL